jgi:uncharacterized protein
MATDAEISRLLAATNLWWRDPLDWERDDPDLKKAASAGYDHDADVLGDVRPDGLYVLLGPRRTGKSVELKKTISRLMRRDGIDPRRIIHFSCDGSKKADLLRLVRVARDQLTATVNEPRYWFLDEVTGAEKGWPGAIKYLRDNMAGFSSDCVVLTGSSSRDLNEARKALAGRHGGTSRTERFLLPMSFRQFVRALGQAPSLSRFAALPSPEVIPARRWVTAEARDHVQELLPWVDDLANAWEMYCTVGGYPQAVGGFLREGKVGDAFIQDLWDVIHGEALASTASTTGAQTDMLLSALAARLGNPINLTGLAEEIGYASHHTAQARIDALEGAYLLWRSYPSREGRWFPVPGSQFKAYFTDPLLARLAALRKEGAYLPAPSAITEQQIGLLLLRQHENEQMGSFTSNTDLLSVRTPRNKEIDFAGAWTDGVAFEGKYVDEGLKRESQTLRSQIDAKIIRAAVLVTRAAYDATTDVWAVPAGLFAWLASD